ncbi:MAG: methylmalonyl Co-A mutase-associated GTPase MeaB [Acidobacteriota bacterium]|nr:methylmalonyl Co-A mutase-associated GTPase MeaB [Blastocatellia bacterium]MDW8411295.1 methylmalonyl Co-A mutase-associated GTPase MeaB [Acidobacteriota bacterium]
MNIDSLVEGILARNVRSVARAITLAENYPHEAAELLRHVYPKTGKALIIGVTGAPGAGKSSLVDKLSLYYRKERDLSVAIVAVDPSSPFSGGAILGDRIRMQALSLDPKTFIRSMATRGNLGGLSRATADAVAILDSASYDRIIVETVGVGQDEVDIVKTADLSIVVLVPGMGDDVQTIKAGIMEIGDIFVINKADRDGVLRTERELEALLSMTERADGWKPPIVKTIAIQSSGINELEQAIELYKQHLDSGKANVFERKRRVAEQRLIQLLRERLLQTVLEDDSLKTELDKAAIEVAAKRCDPYSIVENICKRVIKK